MASPDASTDADTEYARRDSMPDSIQDEEEQIEREISNTTRLGKLKQNVHSTITKNKEIYIPVRERKIVARELANRMIAHMGISNNFEDYTEDDQPTKADENDSPNQNKVEESTLGPLSIGLSHQINALKQTLKQIDDHEQSENNKLTDDLLHKISMFQAGMFTKEHQFYFVSLTHIFNFIDFKAASLADLNSHLDNLIESSNYLLITNFQIIETNCRDD